MAATVCVTAKLALGEKKGETGPGGIHIAVKKPPCWGSIKPKDKRKSENANPKACKMVCGEWLMGNLPGPDFIGDVVAMVQECPKPNRNDVMPVTISKNHAFFMELPC